MALVDLYQDSVQRFMERVAEVRPDQWDAMPVRPRTYHCRPLS